MAVLNKKANFEFELVSDRYEAGLALLGAEAKAIRTGHIDISSAAVRILKNEIFLINANIPVSSPPKGYIPTRSRKLLLNRKEITSIITKTKQLKLTIVPVKVYNAGRLFKLELALGKHKKKFEKRASIKKKDTQREFEREFKIN
ncbi:SsrA-binding protein SmpB [Candidatus Microgenomates bacterium]|nr:SsrA-binding protein SmpB [Candidatus Microgenomates bacterium]